MGYCTTAIMYAGFKSAISAASAAIGSSIMNAANYSGYSAAQEATKASALGGATLGLLDFVIQGSLHRLAEHNLFQPVKVYSGLVFACTHISAGIVGFKLLSLLSESIETKMTQSSMLVSTGVGSSVLCGGVGVLLCTMLLCRRLGTILARNENDEPQAEQAVGRFNQLG